MFYIIKPDTNLTQDQRIRIRVDLERQLTDGGRVVVLPQGCSIETLDTALASAGFFPAHAPLWKRIARAFGFGRESALDKVVAELIAKSSLAVRAASEDVKHSTFGHEPPHGLIASCRANIDAPRRETIGGKETPDSIMAYKMWLSVPGVKTFTGFDKARCEHDYQVDRFGPQGQYICLYCRDIKIQKVES